MYLVNHVTRECFLYNIAIGVSFNVYVSGATALNSVS